MLILGPVLILLKIAGNWLLLSFLMLVFLPSQPLIML